MINIGAVDTHIDPIPTRINIRVNLQLQWAIPVASWYVTNTRGEIYCIPVDEQFVHHASYLITGFVLSRWRVPASPWRSHLCLASRWWMPSHREGPKNISPSSEEQIPLSSCPVTCQTFRCAWKLSLWSPCYRWRLSNPKAHRLVGSDWDTLMVWGTKTHANTSCYYNWIHTILTQFITNKFGLIQYDCSTNVIISMLF